MKILALDPAAVTGWAYQDTNILDMPRYGVWLLTASDNEHPGCRLGRLRELIHYAHQQWGIERIAYEDATYGSHNAHTQSMHNELRGVIKLAAAELNVPCIGVNPLTLKKFFTGYGRAGKDQIIRACETLLGIKTEDSNVADALMVLEWAKVNGDKPIATPGRKPRRPHTKRPKTPRLF